MTDEDRRDLVGAAKDIVRETVKTRSEVVDEGRKAGRDVAVKYLGIAVVILSLVVIGMGAFVVKQAAGQGDLREVQNELAVVQSDQARVIAELKQVTAELQRVTARTSNEVLCPFVELFIMAGQRPESEQEPPRSAEAKQFRDEAFAKIDLIYTEKLGCKR